MEAWRQPLEAEILRLRQRRRGIRRMGLVRFNNSKITRFVIWPGKSAILETREIANWESQGEKVG
jgi:hypothetical protein